MDIPKDFSELVIEPLREIKKNSYEVEKWRKFVEEHIDFKQKYFDCIVNNPEFFLESKSKKELTNFLYQNSIEGYFHIFVFNIHNITYRIPPELKYNSTQLKVINDIFLEYSNFEFEMYNLKIYHQRSEGGISNIRNKISDLIERYFGIQLELNEIPQRYEFSFPKITNYYGNARDQVYFGIYFVQNFPPIYTHDNIYFRINHRQNEQIKSWEDVDNDLINSLINFLNELKRLEGINIISINELPKIVCKMLEPKDINILHLSDLHFGIENTNAVAPAELEKRETTLQKLIENLKKISKEHKEWKPDIIAISGDIGYAGKEEDYLLAKEWFTHLLSNLNIGNETLIICPGNHDRYIGDASTSRKYPIDINDSDKNWYEFESEDFQKRFNDFIDFSNNFLTPLILKNNKTYLSGYRDIKGVRFIVLNSARYAYGGKKDKGNLYLGWPDVNNLIRNDILVDPNNYDKSMITISLFHHPNNWFHDSVINELGRHAATYNFLASRSHIMLSGHLHAGRIGPPYRIGNGATHFSVGASYLRQDKTNNCAILKIDLNQRILKRLIINFNPSEIEWIPDLEKIEEFDLRIKRTVVHSPFTHVGETKKLAKIEDVKNTILKNFIEWKDRKVNELMLSKLNDENLKNNSDFLFSCIIPMSYSEDLINFLAKSTDKYNTVQTKEKVSVSYANPDYYSRIEQYFRDLNPIKKSQTYSNPDFLSQYITKGSEILIHKNGIVYICYQYGLLEMGQFIFNPNPLFNKGFTVYDIKKHQETYGIPISDYSPQNIAHFIKLLLFPFIPECKIKLVAIPTNEFLGYFVFPLMKINDKNRKLYEELPFSPRIYTGSQRDVLIEEQFKFDDINTMIQSVKKKILTYFRNKADTAYI